MSAGQLEDIVTGHKYDDAPSWMKLAAGELGQKEADPYSRVHLYFEKCGVAPDPRGTPWCRYFVDYCLRESGWETPSGGMARGLVHWGTDIDLSNAKLGDIVILWRGTHDDGVSGHVGFFIKQDAGHVYLLGGNQGDAVTEAKFLKSRVLFVRRPRSMWKSKISWASASATVPATGMVAEGVQELAKSPVVEHANEVKGILEYAMQYFPNYKMMLGLACIGIMLYILYIRRKERATKGV